MVRWACVVEGGPASRAPSGRLVQLQRAWSAGSLHGQLLPVGLRCRELLGLRPCPHWAACMATEWARRGGNKGPYIWQDVTTLLNSSLSRAPSGLAKELSTLHELSLIAHATDSVLASSSENHTCNKSVTPS